MTTGANTGRWISTRRCSLSDKGCLRELGCLFTLALFLVFAGTGAVVCARHFAAFIVELFS